MIKVSKKYRLQALIEIKRRAKQQAEIKLAKALARLEAEKKRLRELTVQKEEIIRRRREVRMELHQKVVTGKARVKDGSYRINYLRRLDEEEKEKEKQIENQKRTIETCETEVKRARRDYIDAARELKVMEKHKELWQKKVALELSRREETEMDELGNVIHQLKKVA